MPTLLVTGSAGLVGSACVRHFHALGWEVWGLDSGAREEYFGPGASVRGVRDALAGQLAGYRHLDFDVCDGRHVAEAVATSRPGLVIHAAAQPSHDYAADHPSEDFAVNAGGTLHLLEAVRRHAPSAVFCFLSTNKVYGDVPNRFATEEQPTRYDFAFANRDGVDELLPVDQSTHSLFGCSKLAADLYVQEYGRYFGLKTVCFRAGCLTGIAHAGCEQHGFLAYLARCCREGRPYKVYGHKGKQVRDQLHAADLARACEEFYKNPRPGEAYNLGGGRQNSVSVLEAIALVERATGKRLQWEYVDEPRKGDHLVWITDTRKFRAHYPGWSVGRSLADIIEELTCSTTPTP